MALHKGLRVFIVDDNEMTRWLLRTMIQGDLYDVVGDASTAVAATERLRALRPDIVCLDVMMPDSDGLSLLDWIRGALPRAVILMVSACNDRDTIEAALGRGASGFIVKPFNPGTVLDTLNDVAAQLRVTRGEAPSPRTA
jgi:two-component system chemotaxis response regulator CheY